MINYCMHNNKYDEMTFTTRFCYFHSKLTLCSLYIILSHAGVGRTQFPSDYVNLNLGFCNTIENRILSKTQNI